MEQRDSVSCTRFMKLENFVATTIAKQTEKDKYNKSNLISFISRLYSKY